jgi:hypothetical protein
MFKRQSFLFGILLLAGSVACQSPSPEATLASPEPLATMAMTSTPEPTATPSPMPEPAGEEVGAKASPTPTIPWQIPEIGVDDWVKGGADAGLTIVEYSDFQ